MKYLSPKSDAPFKTSFWAGLLAITCPLGAAPFDINNTNPDLAGFKQQIAPLIETYCIDCHDDSLKKGNLSLEKLDPNLITGDDYELWRMIEEQVAFGEMPPKKKSQPTDAERLALLNWIKGERRKVHIPGIRSHEKLGLPQFGNDVDHQILFGGRQPRVIPAPPRIWRLRPEIYERSINAPHKGGRVDGLANGLNVEEGSGFKDFASLYFLDEAGTNPLLGNARKIADAMVSKNSRNDSCRKLVDDQGPPSAQVIASAIESVFLDALGRKPTDEERTRFAAFHNKASATGGYKPAGKALITAILMQPEFLFRQELGDGNSDEFGRSRLTPREIAFALSYALSDEPLDEFFKAGQAGELATSQQVESAVRSRLVDESLLQGKNPRMLQFFREYFNYPFANEVFKDRPEGGDHDSARLVADLETTIRDILRDDKDVFAQLLTTRKFHVDASYREIKREGVVLQKSGGSWNYPTAYNLPWDWKWNEALQPVEFRADERAGVLTHPAWLAAWSGNFENHPVQRGKWIRTHLLGGSVPDVPIGVDARVPEKEHTTFRDRLKIATSAAECWRCHKKMDPLGVAFERYDHYGRYQRRDAGQPVDASALISLTGIGDLDGRQVTGPTELVEILARSEYVEQVFVRHVFRYFMGRNETIGDANTLQDAHEVYRKSGGSFRALVASLLSSDSFLLRRTSGLEGSRP